MSSAIKVLFIIIFAIIIYMVCNGTSYVGEDESVDLIEEYDEEDDDNSKGSGGYAAPARGARPTTGFFKMKEIENYDVWKDELP